MWHKFKKDLFSYYSMQKVNRVMGVNGIMRTCHMWPLKKTTFVVFLLLPGKKKKLSHRVPKTFHYVCMLQGHIMY